MMFIGVYFLLILLLLTIFSGVVVLVDRLLKRHQKKKGLAPEKERDHIIVDYARSLFPVFLIVLLLRAFVAQPFKVPTGSLEPTVMPGDFILVTQFNYGLKLPVWHTTLIPTSEPKRGQIALFRWPVNPHVTFVKRVIGVPGDTISYINKVLYINGKKCDQHLVKESYDLESGKKVPAKIYEENLLGVKHFILRRESVPAEDFKNLKIPQGEYLMMGDNRDDSDDSRDWGLVPAKNFIGEAQLVLFNWNSNLPWSSKVDWHRIGTIL